MGKAEEAIVELWDEYKGTIGRPSPGTVLSVVDRIFTQDSVTTSQAFKQWKERESFLRFHPYSRDRDMSRALKHGDLRFARELQEELG